MGKFQIKKVLQQEKILKERKMLLIKASLKTKPLLTPIPDPPETPIQDGILLFGKHKNRKISELLNSYEDAAYVTEYLLANKDLPKRFRDQISSIIDSQDPFDSPVKTGPMKTRVVEGDEEDSGFKSCDFDEEEIPW
jgi:hypothetical protein